MESNDSVTVTSSTDSADQVAHAMGKKIEQPATEVAKPVEGKEPTETVEASGTQEDGEGQEERQAKSGKDGFQKRIDKLTKDRAESRRERDYWRDLALKGQTPPAQPKAQEPEKKAAPTDGRPNKDDFKTHEEYQDALIDWKAEQKAESIIDKKLSQRDAKQKEDQLKSEMDRTKKAHLDRVEAFRKDHEDWSEVLSEINDFRLSASLERALVESENGPELMYEFGKNPAELERINALEPSAQARALGRFEASLTKAQPVGKEAATEVEAKAAAESAKPKPKISKAPTPIKPVGSKAGNPKSIFDDNLSDEEWVSMRNKQLGR